MSTHANYKGELHTYPFYYVKQLNCNQILAAVNATVKVCPICQILVQFDTQSCPRCDRPLKHYTLEDMQDGNSLPDSCYRVCSHCEFAFFWADEVCVEDEQGRVMVEYREHEDGTSEPVFLPRCDAVSGAAYYVCPRCGKPTG